MEVTIKGHVRTKRWQDINGYLWIEQDVRLQFSQKIVTTRYGPIDLKTLAVVRTGEGTMMLMGQPLPVAHRSERTMTTEDYYEEWADTDDSTD